MDKEPLHIPERMTGKQLSKLGPYLKKKDAFNEPARQKRLLKVVGSSTERLRIHAIMANMDMREENTNH